MDEFENWDEEKVKRLATERKQKPVSQAAHTETDGVTVPPENKPSMTQSAYQPKKQESFISKIVVVPVSVAIGFLISAVTVWPFAKIVSVSYFHHSAKTSHTIACIAALVFMYPISGLLENIRLLRGKKVNTLKIFLVFVACFLIFLFVTRVVMTPAQDKKDLVKDMAQAHVISEKQLPLPGYDRGDTKKYLKTVQEISSQLGPATNPDKAYENYKKTYIDPLKSLGYEYDITIAQFADRFVYKNTHVRTKEEFELMVFNAVCFRERLQADGIITEETRMIFNRVALEWVDTPSVQGGKAEYDARMADYDSKCPVTDIWFFYPGDSK